MSEQGKYPSNEDVADFITKSSFVTTGIINMSMTDDQLISIIRSACDWQRERDAEICDMESDNRSPDAASAAKGCAEKIRNPVQA